MAINESSGELTPECPRHSERDADRRLNVDIRVQRMTGPERDPGRVGLGEIFGVFLWIGTTSFGGGAVGYLRQSLVLDKGWLDEARFLSGLELSQTLPGLILVRALGASYAVGHAASASQAVRCPPSATANLCENTEKTT